MTRRWYGAIFVVALSLSGCLWDDTRDGRSTRADTALPANLPPGSEAANTRTYAVFSELLAANPDIVAQLAPNADANFRPALMVIGRPGVSLFHRGTRELFITEGLVTRCKTDGKNEGELAAVLASELGKMVVEADAQKTMRAPAEVDRPFAPRVTNDSRDPDQTALATQGYWEKENAGRRNPAKPMPNQDPKVLARNYLSKANFAPDDLLRVAPLIRQAEANPEFEKQLDSSKSRGGLGIFK